MLFTSFFDSTPHCISNCQHIITINPLAIHIKCTPFAVQLPDCRSLLDRHTHAIAIIYNEEDHWQFVNLGKIERLVEWPTIGSSITHLAHNNLISTSISNRKGCPYGQRKLPTNNSIAAHKTAFQIEKVHRSTTSPRTTSLFP